MCGPQYGVVVMPLLGFQKQFAPLVESGEKRQTIRAFRKAGRDPKVGETLYLYTGLRTKACRKLGEATCIEVRTFNLECSHALLLDGRRLDYAGKEVLAWADGFRVRHLAPYGEMVQWFEKTHGLPFEGLLIRWGELTPPEDK